MLVDFSLCVELPLRFQVNRTDTADLISWACPLMYHFSETCRFVFLDGHNSSTCMSLFISVHRMWLRMRSGEVFCLYSVSVKVIHSMRLCWCCNKKTKTKKKHTSYWFDVVSTPTTFPSMCAQTVWSCVLQAIYTANTQTWCCLKRLCGDWVPCWLQPPFLQCVPKLAWSCVLQVTYTATTLTWCRLKRLCGDWVPCWLRPPSSSSGTTWTGVTMEWRWWW